MKSAYSLTLCCILTLHYFSWNYNMIFIMNMNTNWLHACEIWKFWNLQCSRKYCNETTLISSLRVSMKLSVCILITVKNNQTNTIQQCEFQKTFLRLVMKLYEAMLIRLIRTTRLTWSSISENSLDQTVFFVWLD